MISYRSLDKYLQRYSEYKKYPIYSGKLADLDQIVVIPALAEKNNLFSVLSSLACNRDEELKRCLIICVINNRSPRYAKSEDIRNNTETMMILDKLIHRSLPAAHLVDDDITACLRRILSRPLRLAYIDASSSGQELPDKGGVGHARKIGLDRALTLFDYNNQITPQLLCLDADTYVDSNYLSYLKRRFEDSSLTGAVVSFSHRIPSDRRLAAAICRYEVFLRYYVLGLGWAGSPYAFYTIGSTMAFTAAAYVAVRGMPCRQAGEDFYFLNKLNKYYPLGYIYDTTVFPSARPSDRVPFGTGRCMLRFLDGSHDEYLVYNPRVFSILKAWLEVFARDSNRPGNEMMAKALSISPHLYAFLDSYKFTSLWDRIRNTNGRQEYLTRQFHCWFDGFKTLKLIHYLTEKAFPPTPVFDALNILLQHKRTSLSDLLENKNSLTIDDQLRILDFLRRDNFA